MRLSKPSLLLLISSASIEAFQVSTNQQRMRFVASRSSSTSATTATSTSQLYAAANRKSSFIEEEAAILEMEEQGAGVVGAKFFGGNKQKEELFDPIAEANAGVLLVENQQDESAYVKWDDEKAFPDARAQALARSIQGQLNGLLYTEENAPDSSEFVYASSVDWQSPLGSGASNPFAALEESLEFYNRLDVAVSSGRVLSSTDVELRWEISVVWPNFWEGRVLLTGKSILTLSDDNEIIKQVDVMDQESNLNGLIASQAQPRFWDTYHIGMSPSSEISPKFQLKSPGIFSRYKLYQLPPRLVYQPSILDTGRREDAAAATVPNHAFCDFIKTMGPRRQRYVPASPLEVRIAREPNSEKQRLVFSMPLSVELQTNPTLPLPGADSETPSNMEPTVDYVWQGARTVATVQYTGSPQDEKVSEIRKKLYESVVEKDGLQPKLDAEGRPQFFFWSNNVKACYTESGLGMSVYEYRPAWARSSEIGIELAMDNDIDLTKFSV